METDPICRFCLTACRYNCRSIEESDYETLIMLLPTLDLQLTKDPVVCKMCSEMLQKYLKFKMFSLHIKYEQDGKNVCMFCKSATQLANFLSFQNMDVFLLRTMMEKYFPLELQVNVDLLSICYTCRKNIQKILKFLVNWQNVEQNIEKYCQTEGTFSKGDINLKHVEILHKEAAKRKPLSRNTSIVLLEENLCARQETSKDISGCYTIEEEKVLIIPMTYKPMNMLNKNHSHSKNKHEVENVGVVDFKSIEISIESNSIVDTTKHVVNSSTVNLEADQCIKEELGEEIDDCCDVKETVFSPVKPEIEDENILSSVLYKMTECFNEYSGFIDQKVKLEHDIGEGNNTDVNDGERLKVEQVWLEENVDINNANYDVVEPLQSSNVDKSNIVTTGDRIHGGNESAVRRSVNYENRGFKSGLSDWKVVVPGETGNKNKPVFKALSEEVKANMLHLRHWWTNTAVISKDSSTQQYFSKPELRAMISRIQVSGEKKYQCQVCHFISRAKCSMNKHMMLHQHPSELQVFHCQDCDFKTNRKSGLTRHVKSHCHPSPNVVYQCEHCPFTAVLRKTLHRHLLSHDKVANFTVFECYDCGFKTWRKSILKNHIMRHRRDQTKKLKVYRCEYCGYESKYKCVFPKHLEMHQQPMQCNYCNFSTKYTSTMRRHLLRLHDIAAERMKRDIAMVEKD